MRNQFIWKQRVQEEKEHLKDYEIFESADYMELLKIGNLYRVPKVPFDNWLNGETE